MGSVNKAIIVGNLGRDPELKTTGGGQQLCKFSVATSEVYTDKSGGRQESTEWHNIIVWGKQAVACGRYLSKGRKVYVEGRIQTRSWEDDSGQKRYMTEIVANKVVFLGRKDTSAQNIPRSEGTHGWTPAPAPMMRDDDRLPGAGNSYSQPDDDIPF